PARAGGGAIHQRAPAPAQSVQHSHREGRLRCRPGGAKGEAVVRRNSSLTLTLIGWFSWVVLGPAPGWAHPLDPALLELWESGDGAVEVLWRLPLTQPMNATLRPVLPDRCAPASAPEASQSETNMTQRWHLACGARSLVGERIGVKGLHERKTDALLRVHLADGRMAQAVLRG